MGIFRFNIAMSLDGFMAGPNQSVKDPLGVGGMGLHGWAVATAAFRKAHGMDGGEVNASTRVIEETQKNVGAYVMGRNMFGGYPGPWEGKDWNGWWGENPPFHVPVYVVTHHPRSPLVMQGGTTFHFVTDGIESALAQAKKSAAGKDIVLGGGANVIRQYLAARLIDEVNVAVVPILLGSGERLFDRLGETNVELEQTRAIEAPGVTHLRYRVVK